MTKYAILAAWILQVMNHEESSAPWKATYAASADAIAHISTDAPLFQGDDGPRKTASEFLSIGLFESHYDPRAEGDRACLKWEERPIADSNTTKHVCVKQGAPHSFCMFQISDGNFEWLNTTREKIQNDFQECLRAAHTMIKTSHKICRDKPKEDRLNWYARGGDGCDPYDKGKHRVLKSGWIFAHYPALAGDATTSLL